MPFKSKAQMRKCYADKKKGKSPGWNCDEWSSKTESSSLPERVSDKKSKNRMPSRKKC